MCRCPITKLDQSVVKSEKKLERRAKLKLGDRDMNTKTKENTENKSSAESFESRYVSRPGGAKVSSPVLKSYPAGFGKYKAANPNEASEILETQNPNVSPISFTRPSNTVSRPQPLNIPEARIINRDSEAETEQKTARAVPSAAPVSRPGGEEAKVEDTKLKPKPKRWLTARDLEILEFALDMKFVSVADVFDRFFSVLKNGEQANSEEWAAKRMSQLSQAGFVKSVDAFSEPTRYYIATEEAYLAVMQKIESEKVPKAIKSIDQRIFLHDKLVLKARLEFERQNPGCRWISDRRLRAGMAQMFSLPSVYIPDAIYELSSGEIVAFELENAMKGKSAYQEKISYFAKLIEIKKNEPGMFTRVAYRCVREDVYKKLKEETDWYEGKFTVDLWQPDFLKPAVTSKPIVSTPTLATGENPDRYVQPGQPGNGAL